MNQINIPYRIHQIQTKQFAIFPENLNLSNDNIVIQTGFGFGYSRELDSIRCTAKFDYVQDERLVLTSEIQCFFAISEEGRDVLLKSKVIPVDFLRYMATITTGTARGIIHSKTEGTPVNYLVLPPINVTENIDRDLKIEF